MGRGKSRAATAAKAERNFARTTRRRYHLVLSLSWKLGCLIWNLDRECVQRVGRAIAPLSSRTAWRTRSFAGRHNTHIVARCVRACIGRYGFSYLIALPLARRRFLRALPRQTDPTMRERKLYSFHYVFYSDNPVYRAPPAHPSSRAALRSLSISVPQTHFAARTDRFLRRAHDSA